MTDLGYLGAAFIAAWLALGAYITYVARAQRRLAERLDRLEDEPPPRT